jgi:hypothetical protein
MTCDVGHHVGAEHLAFAQSGFELAVVNASVTPRHQQHGAAIGQLEGQGFGNTPWLHAVSGSGQGHGGGVASVSKMGTSSCSASK